MECVKTITKTKTKTRLASQVFVHALSLAKNIVETLSTNSFHIVSTTGLFQHDVIPGVYNMVYTVRTGF